MALHELNFGKIARLEQGKCAITVSEVQLGPAERMAFRGSVGKVRTGMVEALRQTPVRSSPYADKDDRVKQLAAKLGLAQGQAVTNEQLLALISTCSPIEGRDEYMAAIARENFTIDENLIRPAPPRLATPGELLAFEKDYSQGIGVIPIPHGIELYILMAGILRQAGMDAHLSYLNAYAFPEAVETPYAAVTIIGSQPNISSVMVTSPCFEHMANTPVVGVRIMDEASVLSYLNLRMADDASRMLDYQIRPEIAQMLGDMGYGRLLMAVAHGAAFQTPAGAGQIKLPWLLSPDVGGAILGSGDYNRLVARFEQFTRQAGQGLDALATTIGNALSNALQLDRNNPFFQQVVGSIFTDLTPVHQERIIQDLKRFGHDLIRLMQG